MNVILITALSLYATTVGAAPAAGNLEVGIAEWQPRQAVLTKPEAEQRHLRLIRPKTAGQMASSRWAKRQNALRPRSFARVGGAGAGG